MKIGFVTPWFGLKIQGGAEAELRGLILHLKDVERVQIEVLTTCVKDFTSDWNTNYHPEGIETMDGFIVRRFPVRKRNTAQFDQVNAKLMRGSIPLTKEEEHIYVKEMVNSPKLYRYMESSKEEYDLFVFIPYMFGTTYYGAQIAPEKSVLIPCFHEESYIHMKLWDKVFPYIAGMAFLSGPEKRLASTRFDLSRVNAKALGAGVDTDFFGDEDSFRKKYNISSPFLLYAGRKDAGKRVDLLLQFFFEYKKRNVNDLKLVMIGGGNISIPQEVSKDILDLGFVDIQDKYDAYKSALALCQPSDHESFSIVIMESWLSGRPVIVNERCDVTCDFAKQSNGGLYFNSYADFEGVVNYYIEHPDIADQLGENGRNYVLDNFSWDVIVDKYMKFFDEIIDGNRNRV